MKKTQLIVIFIIVIMISSAIGFVYINPDANQNANAINYKGFDFTLTSSGKYIVNIEGKEFIFDYLPDEIKDIEMPDFSLASDKYYLITNPLDKNENIDYSLNKIGYTLNLLGIRAVLACDIEQECDPNMPIKDCSNDAFYFKKSNVNKVYLQDKCLVIEGDETGLSKSVDKIDLKLANIE